MLKALNYLTLMSVAYASTRYGYVSQQKATICDARRPFGVSLDAYISRYGNFCAHDNNNDTCTVHLAVVNCH